MTVLYNVAAGATVYKIKKIDYIALYRKQLIIKYIYTESKVDNKGTQSLTETAHRRDSSGQVAETCLDYEVPHRRDANVKEK